MAGYIKSHSNYRLQERHQLVNDGVIFERDISTVGGVNSFATGQATVYQSGNFVIVLNNGSSASRHVKKGGWLASGNNSDIWDAEILDSHSSDVNGSVEENIVLKNDFMDLRAFAYYGSLSDLIENSITKILTTFPYEAYSDANAEPVDYLSGSTYYELSNPGNIDMFNVSSQSETSYDDGLGHFYNDGYKNYGIYPDVMTSSVPVSGYSFTWQSRPYTVEEIREQNPMAVVRDRNGNYIICPTTGVIFGEVDIEIDDIHTTINLYSCWDTELNVKYCSTVRGYGLHIRPRIDMDFYQDFIKSLDLFGKTLMGYYSGVKNVAKFEILQETDNGTSRTVRNFELPTSAGKYNPASYGIPMENYIKELGKIGNMYDGYYTDNLYRMMTHDSLKNLDWTNGFNGAESEDNHYVRTGEKFASVIRVMGYVFDNEKSYIDSIGNVNTITYSNRSNLSDYFLTDSIESDGWIITNTYPYKLTFYDRDDGSEVSGGTAWSEFEQTKNLYSRKFSEITGEVISPYEYNGNAHYTKCVSGYPEDIDIVSYSGQSYIVDDGKVYNVITDYSNEFEVDFPEVNNEFMKRLRINSRNILRKKGTVEGIESLLSLFGMRSKMWVESHSMSSSGSNAYDFDITESTTYASYIEDNWDNQHNMYRIDWYNRCKTIPYPTQSYINGKYISYQGLPVAYKDVSLENNVNRRLYPYFSNSGYYDGGMYYQMNGGWLNFYPFRFDVNDDMLVYDSSYPSNVETIRDVMMVNDLNELLEEPISELYNDVIYYVNNIDDEFALINGMPYPLKTYSDYTDSLKYFEIPVYGSSVSVGGDLYTGTLTVSDPNGNNYRQDYDLDVYDDGTMIRVYYTGDRSEAFYLFGTGTESTPTTSPATSYIFENGTYIAGDAEVTHYFQLSDVNEQGKIGDGYWRQIEKSEKLYQMVDSIVDKYDGNNPHSGRFMYDDGEEYLNRYKKLFKYASSNRYFNESCFTDTESAYTEINSYGFNSSLLIDNDKKVHAFIDTYDENHIVSKYNTLNKSSLSSIPDYNGISSVTGGDGEPSQIINRKNIEIKFYLKSEYVYTKSGQEEIKYIQSRIVPYIEQMIPSTAIVKITYQSKNTPVIYGSFNESYDETDFSTGSN